MVQALIDSGCIRSGIIDDEITIQLSMPRIPIHPRPLQTTEDSTIDKPILKFITHVSLNLDDYITPKLCL